MRREKFILCLCLQFLAIPWVGYFDYTIPLKKVSEEMPFVLANHISYSGRDMSFLKYMHGKPQFAKKLVNKFILPSSIESFDSERGN
ncbi:MAG: hypothetical protein KJ718_00370 [Nanoarchaeota archaeon]|nr:hypothetical protein [Nanoarchaeota archaeon]MBU1050995.1 hypothetical protein [Nanoarchaeota archaeon]MBU1988338.1 hypothetical protein [Nanoarchaeota archaeon]